MNFLRRLFGFRESTTTATTTSTMPTASMNSNNISIASLVNQTILSAAGVSEGQWIDAGRLIPPFSIVVFGFNSGDEVQVFVSNQTSAPALTTPAPGDGTVAYGAPMITTDTVIPINHSVRWVRCRKSAAAATPAATMAALSGMAFN